MAKGSSGREFKCWDGDGGGKYGSKKTGSKKYRKPSRFKKFSFLNRKAATPKQEVTAFLSYVL